MYREYKTETQRLMGMMINSIYTHKEIFLREIISNASDALDKLAFLTLTDPIADHDRSQLEIKISFDKPDRLLIVEDNGIGMNEEDLVKNLGTIAWSGSDVFSVAPDGHTADEGSGDEADANHGEACDSCQSGARDAGTPELIGQFGVGFYSAFMVADKVTVRTRRYDSTQGYEWVSEGAQGYSVQPYDVKEIGTTVILHIREDEDEKDEFSQYLREYPIYKLIKKYSDYIRWPIRMNMPHPEMKAGCDPKDPEYEEKFEFETVNSMCPIWKRNKSDVTGEDYNNFYKEHFRAKTDPLKVIAVSVDGNVSYQAVLYIPSESGTDYGSEDYKNGPELYCNGVKIMEHCDALIPEYYNFIRGIVETNDISLNVSREMLQQDRQLAMIVQNIEKKIRSALDKLLSDDRKNYERFFKVFGNHLKGCAMEDFGAKQDKLEDLLLYASSVHDDPVTLKEYVSRMKEGQKYIFYASAPDTKAAAMLPQTQIFIEKGYEVLYFTERLDELTAQMFGNYHNYVFKSVVNGGIDLGDENKLDAGDMEVIEFLRNTLGSRVDEVKTSARLKDNAVMLTSGDGITFEMERYFRSLSADMPMHAKKILEINPEHRFFAKLKYAVMEDPVRAKGYAEVLYQQGRILAGIGAEDPIRYTELLCELL